MAKQLTEKLKKKSKREINNGERQFQEIKQRNSFHELKIKNNYKKRIDSLIKIIRSKNGKVKNVCYFRDKKRETH